MFPVENSKFPFENWTYWFDKYDEWSAWYSGSNERLLKYYTNKMTELDSTDNLFFAKLEKEERANVVHMPAAGDIASMSSNLLFSEPPVITMSKDNTSDVIKSFIEENSLNSFLLESGELAAALSGVFLKLNFEKRLTDLPILTMINPEFSFPSFLYGRLWEVLFYREVRIEKEGTVIYRLFENRSRINDGKDLQIEYKLYKGTGTKVGKVVDLNSIPETENLNLADIVINKIDGLGVIYVPNMRPNKLQPGSSLGINDYSSVISMMDSLDLAFSSWVRDIELGMGQLFIDEELTTRHDNITGETSVMGKFSKFQKCFVNINLSNYKMGSDSIDPIKAIQFEMRTEEHMRSCEYFFSQIVNQSGYSPSSFGINADGGFAQSGTALRIRDRKSMLTRDKKAEYWKTAIKQLLIQAQTFYNSVNSKFNNIDDTLSVELGDSIIIDAREQSETLRNLDQARAISTEMRVKMLHPDWDEEKVNQEVKKIYDEEGIEKTSDIFGKET